MVSESNLALLLAVLFGAIFIYELKRLFFRKKLIVPMERELWQQVLQLQTALCDLSSIISSVEKSFKDIYTPQSAEIIKNVSRSRAFVTALYRRLEQVNSLLESNTEESLLAAEDLLQRAISTRPDSVDGLIIPGQEDEIISPENWLGEIRRIRRELLIVPVKKAA